MKYMKQHFGRGSAITLIVCVSAVVAYAQATSRIIPFFGIQTTLPASTTQAVSVQMFDEGGTLITFEDHPAVSVDESGRISFFFGSMTGGLNPDHFPSGASRFLDVIDPATGASVLGERIALNATAFALSPGPQGPPGEQGRQGDPGPEGPPGRDGRDGVLTLPFSGTVSTSLPAVNVGNTGSGHGLVVAISGERAVFGQSNGLNGSGAVGVANNGPQARGLWGFSSTGFGVVGEGAPVGVLGAATSSGAFSQGVRGVATATSGLTFGVWGESLSTSAGAVGVLGRSGTAGNTSGVWGETNSPAGVGGTFFNAAGGDIIRGLNSARQQVFRVTNNGTTVTRVLSIQGGADLSERFDVRTSRDSISGRSRDQIEPGMVVSIDPRQPGKLIVSTSAYDRRAAGVISGAGGVKPGMLMGQVGTLADGDHPVALSGRVYVWADASRGAIEPGDLLTTSETSGHARKVRDYKKAQGAIIGKAMTGLREGRGLVLMLVTLQ